jgi:hypothetical protein
MLGFIRKLVEKPKEKKTRNPDQTIIKEQVEKIQAYVESSDRTSTPHLRITFFCRAARYSPKSAFMVIE